MANTATRLITLIFLLQNQPSQKASELAEKLGVSLRTIHRWGWWYVIGFCHIASPTLEWAASTILAYGPSVEVLDPPELRTMVAEWLETTARRYKS